jgi:hypothetical protein
MSSRVEALLWTSKWGPAIHAAQLVGFASPSEVCELPCVDHAHIAEPTKGLGFRIAGPLNINISEGLTGPKVNSDTGRPVLGRVGPEAFQQ